MGWNDGWTDKKRAIIGDDAEFYLAQLFKMYVNPNGSRRPDLISPANSYKPRFTLEVKSGKCAKGVMVDYQLHYALTSRDDYNDLPDTPQRVFEGMGIADFHAPKEIAYYHAVVSRDKSVKSEDIKMPFATMKIDWQDVYIAPNEFGFYSFVRAKTQRTGLSAAYIIEELTELMLRDARGVSVGLEARKMDPQSWQNLFGEDIKALVTGNLDDTTKHGRIRIDALRRIYPGVDDLKGMQLQGPQNTTLYILFDKDHYALFNTQLRKTIGERLPFMEEVALERIIAREWLRKVKPKIITREDMFGGKPEQVAKVYKGMTKVQWKTAQRLAQWRHADDTFEPIPMPFSDNGAKGNLDEVPY
ncbi:hypothetical protein C4573_01730 [Candidatus Woesearchaeota archaeon]|nr:MAG: hypothetical protein C4573_01730 [Candidatus Woesearchaeota archaeon]